MLAGLWECTSGSVIAGESSYDGIIREIKEEIGIDIDINQKNMIHSFIDDDAIFEMWYFKQDVDIGNTDLQISEVDNIKYMNKKEILKMIRDKEICPIFECIERLVNDGIITIK